LFESHQQPGKPPAQPTRSRYRRNSFLERARGIGEQSSLCLRVRERNPRPLVIGTDPKGSLELLDTLAGVTGDRGRGPEHAVRL
jgi:hypothetical protein